MTKITVRPNEGGTFAIDVDFLDIDGDAFTPKTCEWSLSTPDGTIINSRDKIAATVTGSSHAFVLTGADLVYLPDAGARVFTVRGTFDATYGTDLNYADQAEFDIQNMTIDYEPPV